MNCWGSDDGFCIKRGCCSFRMHGAKIYYKLVSLFGNKYFYDIPVRYHVLSQTTQIRHPWLRLRLFGTSSPEIAGCLMGISRNANSLPKSPIYNIPLFHAVPIAMSPFLNKSHHYFPRLSVLCAKFEYVEVAAPLPSS